MVALYFNYNCRGDFLYHYVIVGQWASSIPCGKEAERLSPNAVMHNILQ